MRIAFVSQYYTPEPSRVPTSVSRGLAERGHSVRVVTGFPNYPSGKIYPGYRQSFSHVEDADGGITVRRVPLFASHSEHPVARMGNYLSFMFSALVATPFVKDADVTYVYASQPTGALCAMVWRKLRGTPYVMHVQDLWPDSVTASSMLPARVTKGASAVIETLLRPIYKNASAIVAISPQMRDALAERVPDPARVHVVYNWSADETPHPGIAPGPGTGCTVTYAGNMGAAQGLEVAVAAAKAVASELPGFRLLLVGSGTRVAALRDLAAGSPGIEFRDRVPANQMASIYSETSFQLVSLKDSAMLRGAVPSKLQASLAAGLPVICAAPGDAPEIVRAAGAGIVASPGDVESLADAFRAAYHCTTDKYREYAGSARRHYHEALSSTIGMTRLNSIISDCALSPESRGQSVAEQHQNSFTEGARA